MRKPWCDTKETSKGNCTSVPQAAGFQLCFKNPILRTKVQQKNFKEDEDDLIIRLHSLLGDRWSLIAGRLPGRTDAEIKNYWNTRLRWKLMRMGMDPAKHRMIRHSFPLHREQKEREQFADSSEYDDRVSDTATSSENKVCTVPGFQLCFKNPILRTKVQLKNFKEDEDDLIIRLHSLLGDRWPLIAGRLPGRTEAEIKNYWNTRLRWKLMRMGIDPAKHRMIGHNFPLHREQKEDEQFADSSVDDVRVSDTATSSEDKVCTVPDLNLDLTLS